MKILLSILLLSGVLLTACYRLPAKASSDHNDYAALTKDDTLYLPFDTLKVLERMDVRLSVNEIDRLGNEKIDGLQEEWDTLELTYHMFACDCPRWMIEEEYEAHPEADFFNAPNFAFHIEPASKKLDVEQQPFYFGSTVRFIGKKYKEPRLPKNNMTPTPPAAYTFRYYAYEVLKPAVILGPEFHTGKREIPSDPEELIMRTYLTIRN